uniref:Transmembrane protein n=1 Tax=Angiostrongylus cantonensis TaxID=6313 RepID=A0A0K0D160_ANGCA
MEFDDTSKQYKILSVLHVKYASISCALIGALLIVTAFSLGVTYLPWSCYDTSFVVVDRIAVEPRWVHPPALSFKMRRKVLIYPNYGEADIVLMGTFLPIYK